MNERRQRRRKRKKKEEERQTLVAEVEEGRKRPRVVHMCMPEFHLGQTAVRELLNPGVVLPGLGEGGCHHHIPFSDMPPIPLSIQPHKDIATINLLQRHINDVTILHSLPTKQEEVDFRTGGELGGRDRSQAPRELRIERGDQHIPCQWVPT